MTTTCCPLLVFSVTQTWPPGPNRGGCLLALVGHAGARSMTPERNAPLSALLPSLRPPSSPVFSGGVVAKRPAVSRKHRYGSQVRARTKAAEAAEGAAAAAAATTAAVAVAVPSVRTPASVPARKSCSFGAPPRFGRALRDHSHNSTDKAKKYSCIKTD